jgi:hypothetical protein
MAIEGKTEAHIRLGVPHFSPPLREVGISAVALCTLGPVLRPGGFERARLHPCRESALNEVAALAAEAPRGDPGAAP